ncbi:siderophore-interacting protein [Erwinia sp. S63]|uniref:siderophore-interacting protein n=1 Tax=Erwinia sp. S63 TaxID=2769341 RepID=UPI00190C4EC4|nr:siderophore-interacting protein [Erwinia sp. S63]MBK0097555.1 siderophore-interacting protein [Erwinia sp. S63]
MATVPGYRVFNVTLLQKRRLTPSLMSCVFTGEEVRQMKMDGPDQRIKILFPSPEGLVSSLTESGGWWDQFKSIPPHQRPIMRTYTLRRVIAAEKQMEVEFVIHGTEGPASAWVISAMPGDALQIVAPNRDHAADSGGYEWKPASQVERALIIADETAFPAVKGIIEQMAEMASPPRVQVFQEIPLENDVVDLSHYAFAEVIWLPREKMSTSHGVALVNAVKQHAFIPDYAIGASRHAADDVEGEDLWQSAANNSHRFYGWVAAESSTVKHIRRYLLGERNVAQQVVSFMAYWSRGKG